MKPTSKNIVFEPSWNGIRSPWIGTKNIWDLFVATNLFDVDIYNEIKSKKANEWDKEFGNQVSIVFLKEKTSVSLCRKKEFTKVINGKEYKCYSIFYPVGNGRFNTDKSIEDILWIEDEALNKKVGSC